MNYRLHVTIACLTVASLVSAGRADDAVLLSLTNPGPAGLIVAPVDLTAAARLAGLGDVDPQRLEVRDSSGRAVPFQFVPGPEDRLSGTAVIRLPAGAAGPLRLRPGKGDRHLLPERPAECFAQKVPVTFSGPAFDGTVATKFYRITHDRRQGGLPARIEFASSGKIFDTLRWNDRLHHRELRGFQLAADTAATATRVSTGPLCTVVRVGAAFKQPGGKRPASQPEAIYDWHYFHDRPLVLVRGVIQQKQAFTWHEAHFLEMTFSEKVFSRFAGGDPPTEGPITDSRKVEHMSRWGAVFDGPSAIGMFGCGSVLVYHGPNGYGKYLQSRGDDAWRGWDDTRREVSAWLWIAAQEKPLAAIQAAAQDVPARPRIVASTSAVRSRIEAAAKDSTARWPRAAAAGLLESQGRLAEAVEAAQGKLPPDWSTVRAGDLGVIFARTEGGLKLQSLYDAGRGQELAADKDVPLFEIALRKGPAGEEIRLAADAGWQRVQRAELPAGGVELRFEQPVRRELAGLAVRLRATADAARHRLRWQIDVGGQPAPWALLTVAFPRVALDEGGPQSRVLYPQAAGVVKPTSGGQAGRYQGTYPSGWTAMQFEALYDPGRGTGLYVAVHDPLAGTKQIQMESRPNDRSVILAFEHPVAEMGQAGNRFALSGEAVWQLLRGDWYDASVIYRDWVRKEAKWYPPLGADGRPDTPLWMRELPAWLQTGGPAEQVVRPCEEFAGKLGLPVGLHWYSWHQIPFDNDYPHYFPTKPGFKEAVARLQRAGVQVMPYINGRLWDTRDRGLDDFEFSRLVRPAATKDEQGQPLLEMYSSKEKDGSRVALAAMCPTTRLWQDKLRQIDMTLFDEYGVKGVYMDQVAAARANLCFDRSHGHPLGGGHWWCQQGYWPLLEAIRRAMPKDRMLTTECNAEPYVRWFDGYLTWHWQYDGQVPAFAAVYGGAIQMFGRAYRGGPTRDLALRMKAGQQLVFGEQIGWLGPDVVRQTENFDFLRRAIRLRWNLRRYFYAGEMARPPRLSGTVPTVTADWQWHNQWPVTTDQVLCGAWRLPGEGRLVLMFVNVGDTPVSARLDYDLRPYGLAGNRLRATRVTADGPGESTELGPRIDHEVTFPARTAWAWEVRGT